jgi:hypothetical protein
MVVEKSIKQAFPLKKCTVNLDFRMKAVTFALIN